MSDVDVKSFQENGYLVVEDALSKEEVEELRAETTAICRGERGEYKGFAAPSEGETEADTIGRYLCIHFPHKISKTMFRYLAQPKMVEVLTDIVGPNVKCMQSMLFIKASGKPGQAWHQDEWYIPTRDRSLTGGWMALDDATVENGTLWVIPGSHKEGVLWPMHDHNDRQFDCAQEAFAFPYRDEDAVPVEVKAGAIVFFNGYLLHRSFPNNAASGFRRVLVNHYMSASSLLPWGPAKEGQHFSQVDNRDVVMVAGRDPFAYKGYEDRHTPHIRPDGEGGCGDSKGRNAGRL